MSALHPLFEAFAVLIGLVIGSFLNVAIARWPEDRSVVAPRSHCPACAAPIRWYDNVPLLSWVVLRARCRDCKAPISATYPLVELLGGLLAWLLVRRFVPDATDLDAAHLAAWAVHGTFLALLVVASYVDLRHRIIPDETSLYAAPIGIVGAVLLGTLGYDGWLGLTWRQAVLGAAVGGGFFATMALSARYLSGHEALGWGDVKLITMIGAFVGPVGVVAVMLAGSMLGSLVGIVATLYLRRRPYLPFGPALSVAAAIYVLFGDVLVPAFLPGLARFL